MPFNNKHLLFVSWVHPNMLPPVVAMALCLKEKGYNISLVTTYHQKPVAENVFDKVEIINYSPSMSTTARQIRKLKFIGHLKKYKHDDIKVFSFDNYSFLAARRHFKKERVFFNMLEMFDYPIRGLLFKPFDTIVALRVVSLLKNHKHFSQPSPQRIKWFRNRYKKVKHEPLLIYNAPYVSPQDLQALEHKQYHPTLPVILHSGGINVSRGVLELVQGFGIMKQPAKLVITNFQRNSYCNQIAALAVGKNIELLPFQTVESLKKLRAESDIGVCFTIVHTERTRNIAPNRIGEYLLDGLLVLVNENEYYRPFNASNTLSVVQDISPSAIAAVLDQMVKALPNNKQTGNFREVLSWYSMNKQIEQADAFLHN